MKNLKNTMTLMALFAFLFNYGQKNNPYNHLGVKHNQVLSQAYSQLSEKISVMKKSKSNGYKKINYKQFVDNLLSTNFNKSKGSIDMSFIEDRIGIPPFKMPPFPIGTLPTFPEFKKSVNSTYQKHLEDIYKYGTSFNFNSLSRMVDLINKTTKLTEKEKTELLSILAIAYNSASYWKNNEDKWKELGGYTAKSPIGGIVGADIAGALWGAWAGPGAAVSAGAASVVTAGAYLGDYIF